MSRYVPAHQRRPWTPAMVLAELGLPAFRRDARTCSHHSPEGASLLVSIPDAFACTDCGSYWYAVDGHGRFLRPPRLCPACGEALDGVNVLCRPDWFAVPKAMRDAVWREFRRHRGSPAHVAAIGAAVRAAIAAGAGLRHRARFR